jgi:hypothetical protein
MANPSASSPPEVATRSSTWQIALIVVAAFAARLYLLFNTHRTAEDFYITLRYAENIAQGRGFVYNAGQHVLGTTTPLYTLFLAACDWLGVNATLCGQLANVAADSLTCYAVWRLARAAMGKRGDSAGLAAAAVLAVWPPSLYWSISGMETGLVTLCGVAALAATAERRPFALAVWTTLLALLRIDGLLLAAICFGLLGVARREARGERQEARGENRELTRLVRSLLLFVAILVPWLVFATVYFGSPVPTSLVAKLHVYGWQNPGFLPNLKPFARDMTRNPLYWLLLAGAIPGAWAAWRAKPLRPALVWMALYYAGMAFSKSFLFGWYYVPPAPVYVLASVLGWRWVGLRIADCGLRIELPRAAVAILIVMAGLAMLPRERSLIAADQRQDEALLKATGLMLRDVVKPGETLMLEPIGWIGYYSRARILDAVGLVSPEIIPYFRPGAVSPYLDIMAGLRPEWVLLRSGEYEDAIRAAVPPDRGLLTNYALVRTIPNPEQPASKPAFFLLRRSAR